MAQLIDRDIEALRACEERLLQSEFRRDAAAVAELLSDSFVEFGSSGRRFDKPAVLEFLANEPSTFAASMSDFEATPLAAGVVLVTFRTMQQRDPSSAAVTAWRSSIWRREDSRWRLVFHQGTRVP